MKTVATSKLFTGSILDEQIKLEESAIQDGVARYNRLANEAIKRGDGANLKPAERLMLFWYQPLVDAIVAEQKSVGVGTPQVGANLWGPVFCQIQPDKLAVIALHEMIGGCMAQPDGIPRVEMANNIGRAVIAEINLVRMKEQDSLTRERRDNRLASGEDKKTVYAQERESLEDLTRRFRSTSPGRVNWWAKKSLNDPYWDRRVCTQVGAMLVYLVHESCGIPTDDGSFKLAFHRDHKAKGRKQKGTVRLDQRAIDVIDQGHEIRQFMRPRFLPMLVPPYPWSREAQGGYIKTRTPFVSKPTREQKEALEKADLSQVYDALTAIGEVGWKINARVLNVVREIWNTGGGEMGVPHKSNVPTEPKPSGYDPSRPKSERWSGVPDDVKRAHKRRSAAIIAENIRRVSTRQEFLSKLNIAGRFADEDAIYFPHQFDFRGRTYAIPIHLNHQGDDVCRGLLEFAEAKTPGADGLRSLKIHAASVYGVDSVSFDDRVQWVDAHWQKIMDSADKPLECDFWTHADESVSGNRDGKPWQFLAACMALADPEGAGARLPLHSDGTANGLQHYTAMGRDERAAKSVNMLPANKPESIYVDIAAEIDPVVRGDYCSNPIAAMLIDRLGAIKKPECKTPIMTTVYGVTDYGATEQTRNALAKRGFEGDELFQASRYLSRIVLGGIGTVCERAVAIMDWIRKCATLITSKNRTFTMTSPIGFPVVLRDRNLKKFRVHTILGEIVLVADDATAPVNNTAQVNGSAPNAIHSIDASHMMMTAIACKAKGITTAFVHDAYWTHAATYREMNRELRVQFVKLHSRDLLSEMVAEWRSLHPDIEFPDPPERGSLDINQVVDATYFFH